MATMVEQCAEEGFTALARRPSGSFRSSQEMSELAGRGDKHFMHEQAARAPGTLPPPRDAAAISRARAESEGSLLRRIPHELAVLEGFPGQQMRKIMLHGATIVFVTPGYAGKRFIYERARDLGVRAVIFDEPGSWAEALVADRVIAKFVPICLNQDSDEVFAAALAAMRALEDDPTVGAPAGCCTFCELSVPLVARLCETLGLPGPSAAAIDTARDKHRTRAAMKAAGLPSPSNYKIMDERDLAAAAAEVGFPAVLRPLSGAASLGVKKVGSEDELMATYREVLAEMRDTVVTSGALVKKSSSSSADAAAGDDASARGVAFLLEAYLDGPEVDVDVVMSEGEARYAVVVDNGPTAEPYFAETWGLCPSALPEDAQAELRALAVDALKACGFEVGVFHCELKRTSRGPRLIEINARMGGGQVRLTHLLVHGVDLVDETLFAAAGIPNRPYVASSAPGGAPPAAGAPSTVAALAYNYVVAPSSGTVGDVGGALAAHAARDDVVYAKPLVAAGADVVGPKDGLATWVGDIMVTAATPREALDSVLALSSELTIPMA